MCTRACARAHAYTHLNIHIDTRACEYTHTYTYACTHNYYYILNYSEPEGHSYIETSNLDGETNLKIRQV